jgi:hypothetical protein
MPDGGVHRAILFPCPCNIFHSTTAIIDTQTVECCFAWIDRSQQLAKGFKYYASTMVAFVSLAMFTIIHRCLAANPYAWMHTKQYSTQPTAGLVSVKSHHTVSALPASTRKMRPTGAPVLSGPV